MRARAGQGDARKERGQGMADSGESRDSKERLTSREACQALGITRPILRKWCARLGIRPARHAWDHRYWTLSAGEVARIRAARDQMPRPPGARAPAPVPLPLSMPRAAPMEHLAPGDGTAPGAPRPRRARPTVPLSRRGLPPFPADATRLPELERRYGCPSTSVKWAIAKGILQNAAGGPWESGGPQAILYALLPDQVELAVRRYGGRAQGHRDRLADGQGERAQKEAGQAPPDQP